MSALFYEHFQPKKMLDDDRRTLNDVFGESSSEDDEDQNHISPSNSSISSPKPNETQNPNLWERIEAIKGLWMCIDFLSIKDQALLLSAIEKEGWFTGASSNQAMRFGDLPVWATELSSTIQEAVYFSNYDSDFEDLESSHLNKEEARPLPSSLLWREPLFDQMIGNVYQPGEGICAHVDLLRFEDGIAIVSLESPCVMHFTRVDREDCSNENSEQEAPLLKIPILLTPGSLILMSGEARYQWKHEINRKPGFQVWGKQEIHQQRRISITLRKLCQIKA